MALRRFYFETNDSQFTSATVAGDLFHHIRDVCRFGVGDQFELLPGNGQAILVEIVSMGKRDLQVKRISARGLPQPMKPWVTLALSLPKLPKVDEILEKCVELGVSEVRVFISDYSFLRTTNEVKPARVERWRKIVQGATQQSGRGDLMTVHPPERLEEILKQFNQSPGVAGLFPYEGEAQIGLPEAIRELRVANPEHIWVFVGSEGGFSSQEVEVFARNGLKSVSLGAQILRVETACVALVSVLKYEFGALG